MSLKLLWDDVVREGKHAQSQLHNITHAIVSELQQDSAEQGAYERVMEEAVLPILRTIFEAPHSSPLAAIRVESVIDFLVQVTDVRRLKTEVSRSVSSLFFFFIYSP